MIKKKGALSFKPKAPQAGRRAGAPPSAPASNRQSTERQSQTPAPQAIPTAASPPPQLSSSAASPPPAPLIQVRPPASSPPPEVDPSATATPALPQPVSQAVPPAASPSPPPPPPLQRQQFETAPLPPTPPATAQSIEATEHQVSSQNAGPEPEFRQSLGRSTSQEINSANSHEIFRSTDTASGSQTEDHVPDATLPDQNGTDTLLEVSMNGKRLDLPQHLALSTELVPLESSSEARRAPELAAGDSEQPQELPETEHDDLSILGVGDLSALGAGEADGVSQLVETAELNEDGTSALTLPPQPEKTRKRPTKRRKKDTNGIDIRPTIEVQIHKPRRPNARSRARQQGDEDGKKKRKREETPEDAEEQEIDHTTVKMSELTKDLRIGKRFSKHAEIKQREVQKRAKAKLARDYPELIEGQNNEEEASSRTPGPTEGPVGVTTGPQMRIVNGQIVIDDASLVVDRHAIAAAAAPDMEEVEEDDFTRITTSGTFMKRERNLYWDSESTEKFYMGLRMFGTDFQMISKMFPERNRRQIKLKFNKEEREWPRKIHNALMGEMVKIDLEEYKSHTGLEYEEVADIEAEHAAIEEEHNAEQRRMQAEADETTRQKKAEIHGKPGAARPAGVGPSTGTDSAKENDPDEGGAFDGGKASAASKSKKKAKGKKKRNLHSVRGGGEEVEVLGSIGA
jgi:transcription factor TFIIIB component B''